MDSGRIISECLFLRAKPLLLDRSHPGLRLLQALRDEAYRFGITYHRKLRGRSELAE